jgi:hypothetical protein
MSIPRYHTCTQCGNRKLRIQSRNNIQRVIQGVLRTYPVFVDSLGKKWKSDVCPQCYLKKQKGFAMVQRKKDKVEVQLLDIIEEKHPTRLCKSGPSCKGDSKVELSRYFYCKSCQPRLQSDDGEQHRYVIEHR